MRGFFLLELLNQPRGRSNHISPCVKIWQFIFSFQYQQDTLMKNSLMKTARQIIKDVNPGSSFPCFTLQPLVSLYNYQACKEAVQYLVKVIRTYYMKQVEEASFSINLLNVCWSVCCSYQKFQFNSLSDCVCLSN